MTRKDFEVVAEILGGIDKEAVDSRRAEINAVLRTTNPNFDTGRFWNAVEEWR